MVVIVFVTHILCYDIWFYITHVLLHHKHLYYIHKLHHSTSYKTLTYKDTHTAHVLENVVQPLGIFIPYISVHPNYTAFIIAVIFVYIRNTMRHDDRCSWLIGNHHLLHHKYPKYNLGEYWIDVLCGTVYPRKEEYIHGLIYT